MPVWLHSLDAARLFNAAAGNENARKAFSVVHLANIFLQLLKGPDCFRLLQSFKKRTLYARYSDFTTHLEDQSTHCHGRSVCELVSPQ